MKPYRLYSAEELATDALFMQWVHEPDDAEVAGFWNTWLHQHPQCQPSVELARRYLACLHELPPQQLTPDEVARIWERVRQTLKNQRG
jgi:transmembrane sensor